MSELDKCVECGGPVPARRSGGYRKDAARVCSTPCRIARKKKTLSAWYEAHRSERLSYLSRYNEKYKAQKPYYFRQFYAENRDSRKQEANDWYHANTERALKTQRAWSESHPEQVRASSRRGANKRRAIKKRVFVEVVDPRTVFERDKGMCGICRTRVEPNSKWEIDHMIPISKGGAHAYANVQLAHRTCNRSKSAKLPSGQPTLFQVAV